MIARNDVKIKMLYPTNQKSGKLFAGGQAGAVINDVVVGDLGIVRGQIAVLGQNVISVSGAIRRPPTSMSWSETFRTERKEWPLELMEASPRSSARA